MSFAPLGWLAEQSAHTRFFTPTIENPGQTFVEPGFSNYIMR
jgi:hypothetical protein